MYLVTKEEMAQLDAAANKEYGIPGIILMENAALRVMELIGKFLQGKFTGKNVIVFAGKGNNGGDGLAIARHLVNAGAEVKVFLFCRPEELRGDALINYQIFSKMEGRVHTLLGEKDVQKADICLMCTDLILDAIYGTGFKGAVSGVTTKIIEAINGCGRPVISVDIPSGLDADTGNTSGTCVKAEATVTFGLPKVGLCLEPGAQYVGELWWGDISLPRSLIELKRIKTKLITSGFCASKFPERPVTAHKGIFGHVLAVGASEGFTGAIYLAATAALRSGAGLVTAAVPKSLHNLMEIKTTEVMTRPLPETEAVSIGQEALETILSLTQKAASVLLGPGMSEHPSTASLLKSLLPKITKPFVLDADALNILAENPQILSGLQVPTILTPHPGEMARLLGISTREIQQNRIKVALEAAQKWRVVVILKGAKTIVASPDGQLYLNLSGNPGMASGGVGDVLAGIVAGLLGQGINALTAAVIAVYVHGVAGDRAKAVKGETALTAGDLLEYLPLVYRELEMKTFPVSEKVNDRLLRIF